MTAEIIDGKKTAQELRDALAVKIALLDKKPSLAVVLVGNNEASRIYVRNKEKMAAEVGIKCSLFELEDNISEDELLGLVERLNFDDTVDGILVQMPLPKHINSAKVIEAIDPWKDVDGFSPYNAGLLHLNDKKAIVAATPKGVLHLLKSKIADLSGLHAVIIGRSNIVGRPLASLLLNNDCTVTIAHSRTREIEKICQQADILVAACGCPRMVKKSWLKEGVIVIDVGINRVDGKLCGDVDFEEAKEVASYITPVPGGVGPMTIASLLENTYLAAIMNK